MFKCWLQCDWKKIHVIKLCAVLRHWDANGLWWKLKTFRESVSLHFLCISLMQSRESQWNFDVQVAFFANRIERHQIKMNTRNLVTSLSQQLDTSCTEFPDGFEETQQIQVSFAQFFFFFFIVFKFYRQCLVSSFKLFALVWVEHFHEPLGGFPHRMFANRTNKNENKDSFTSNLLEQV